MLFRNRNCGSQKPVFHTTVPLLTDPYHIRNRSLLHIERPERRDYSWRTSGKLPGSSHYPVHLPHLQFSSFLLYHYFFCNPCIVYGTRSSFHYKALATIAIFRNLFQIRNR